MEGGDGEGETPTREAKKEADKNLQMHKRGTMETGPATCAINKQRLPMRAASIFIHV